MSAHPRRQSAATALMLGLSLAAGLAGCTRNATTEPDTLPPNKQKTLMEGDALISEGETQKEEGMRLRAAGQAGGDDLLALGEDKITRGERMKEKGMMMKD